MAVPSFLSPDGRLLVERLSRLTGKPFTGMGTYWTGAGWRVSDAHAGEPVVSFKDDGDAFYPLAISPDGRSLAAGHLPRRTEDAAPVLLVELPSGK